MAAYAEAKARLLEWPGLHAAVVNAADAFGRRLCERLRANGRPVISYGAPDADIVASRVELAGARLAFHVRTPQGDGRLETALAGAFNVENLLGVLGVLLASGVDLRDALAALSHASAPPGRMERFGGGA